MKRSKKPKPSHAAQLFKQMILDGDDSQAYVAQILKICPARFCRLLKGKSYATLKEAIAIQVAYDIEPGLWLV